MTTKLSDRRWGKSNYDTMGRQSHKALERLKHIASMGESEAKQYLRNEKGGEPAEDSAGSLERVVLRQRRCQWLTELKGWKDCGDVATHVRVDCGLCYCRQHASMLMRFVPLEPLPQNGGDERLPANNPKI